MGGRRRKETEGETIEMGSPNGGFTEDTEGRRRKEYGERDRCEEEPEGGGFRVGRARRGGAVSGCHSRE